MVEGSDTAEFALLVPAAEAVFVLANARPFASGGGGGGMPRLKAGGAVPSPEPEPAELAELGLMAEAFCDCKVAIRLRMKSAKAFTVSEAELCPPEAVAAELLPEAVADCVLDDCAVDV